MVLKPVRLEKLIKICPSVLISAYPTYPTTLNVPSNILLLQGVCLCLCVYVYIHIYIYVYMYTAVSSNLGYPFGGSP